MSESARASPLCSRPRDASAIGTPLRPGMPSFNVYGIMEAAHSIQNETRTLECCISRSHRAAADSLRAHQGDRQAAQGLRAPSARRRLRGMHQHASHTRRGPTDGFRSPTCSTAGGLSFDSPTLGVLRRDRTARPSRTLHPAPQHALADSRHARMEPPTCYSLLLACALSEVISRPPLVSACHEKSTPERQTGHPTGGRSAIHENCASWFQNHPTIELTMVH